jgi:hypothetical protein
MFDARFWARTAWQLCRNDAVSAIDAAFALSETDRSFILRTLVRRGSTV